MKRPRAFRFQKLEQRQLLAGDLQTLISNALPTASAPADTPPTPAFTGEQFAGFQADLSAAAANVDDAVALPYWIGTGQHVVESGGMIYVIDNNPGLPRPDVHFFDSIVPPVSENGSATLAVFNKVPNEAGTLELVSELTFEHAIRDIQVADGMVLLRHSEPLSGLPMETSRINGIPIWEGFAADSITVLRPQSSDSADGAAWQSDTISVDGRLVHWTVAEGRLVTQSRQNYYDYLYRPFIDAAEDSAVEPKDTLTYYDLNTSSLDAVASIDFPAYSSIQFLKSDVIVSTQTNPIVWHDAIGILYDDDGSAVLPEPVSTNTRYALVDDEVVAKGSVESSYPLYLQFSADGQSAIAIEHLPYHESPEMAVMLMDLREGGFSLFDTVVLEETSGVLLGVGSDYALIEDYRNQTLLSINTNLDIDVVAENRVAEIDLGEGVSLSGNVLIDSGRAIAIAQQYNHSDPNVEPDVDGNVNADGTVDRFAYRANSILTIDLNLSEVTAQTELSRDYDVGYFGSLEMIDAELGRVGLSVFQHHNGIDHLVVDPAGMSYYEPPVERFLFGVIDAGGEFEVEGQITRNGWLQREVTPSALLAVTTDELIRYPWNDPNNPTHSPIGDPDPPIIANDDFFEIMHDGDAYVLDLLANDQILHGQVPWLSPTARLMRLEGAPEGIEIRGGGLIWVSPEVTETNDKLEFEYVIGDGNQTSTANVAIEIDRLTDAQIDALTEVAVRAAMDDFDVPIEAVEVVSVDVQAPRIGNDIAYPLASTSFDRNENIEDTDVDPSHPENEPQQRRIPMSEYWLLPRVVVRVATTHGTGRYVIGTDNTIYSSRLNRIDPPPVEDELLIRLTTTVSGAAGDRVNQIKVGDTFFVTLLAEDLRRRSAAGVFSAAVDLELPRDLLQFTGNYELGSEFTAIGAMSLTEHQLDEFNVVGGTSFPDATGRQMLIRLEVRAVAAGEVRINADPADSFGTEWSLYGRDEKVHLENILFQPAEFQIIEGESTEQLDVNRDGRVSASDALQVINFLIEHGSMSVSDLALRLGVNGENIDGLSNEDLQVLGQLDANRNGTISALDALVVINQMNREEAQRDAIAGEDVGLPQSGLEDDLLAQDDDQRRGELF